MRLPPETQLQHRISVGDVHSRCDGGSSSAHANSSSLPTSLPGSLAGGTGGSSSSVAPSSPSRLPESGRGFLSRLAASPSWMALVLVLLLALYAIIALLVGGASNLHLRAATLRAAGGSARLGARGICMLRLSEAAVVWLVLLLLRRGCGRRLPPRPPHGAAAGEAGAVSVAVGSVNGEAGGGGGGGSSASVELGAAAEVWGASDGWPASAYPPDCASPPSHKEAARQQKNAGATLLCTLSGWVWVLLGAFSVLGSICSLLVAIGGRTAPGMLGEMFNHDGPLGRRSVLGRSLPALTWISFEVGSAGALYVATLSTVMLLPQMLLLLCSRPALQSLARPLQVLVRLTAGGGAEPPLWHKLQSLFVHALALLIAFAELCLNDLPVLPQHRPLALLMGCAFSLNLLGWHTYHGRFTYLYADAPRTSAPAALLACVLTPAALAMAFAVLASISASQRVRSPGS